MDQAFFLALLQQIYRLGLGELFSGAPLQGIVGSTIDLNAHVECRVAGRTGNHLAGAGCNRQVVSLVYDLFHYRSWSGIEPEPFLRIKKFPFTMRFVAHGFQFEPDKERQGKRRPIKPAIDWYDPVSKRVLGEQPKKIQVGDLNNKRTEFAVTFESRSVLITSFFARTSEEGVLFDPTVSEDADEDTGPGAVFY